MASPNKIVRSGFGHFSYKLGPWSDYSVGSALRVTADDSGSKVMLGTRIEGGARGAVITCLDVEPPINQAGSIVALAWRVAVIKGEAPHLLINKQATPEGGLGAGKLGAPSMGDGSQDQLVIFSRGIVSQATGVAVAAPANQLHLPFPDYRGPSVGPGEVMTVILFPVLNEDGTPGYGAANTSLLTLSVWGAYGNPQSLRGGDGESGTARALPRSAVR